MECLVIQTERTILRQLQNSDFEDYIRLEGNPEVMKFITGKPRTRVEAGDRFRDECEEYVKDPGFGMWAVCYRGQSKLIGTANLNFIPGTSIRHVGYKFFPEHQGKGLASELLKALLSYGFSTCGLTRISAVCDPDNWASEKVMQKAGMEFIGRDYFFGGECLHYQTDPQKWFRKNL